MRCPDALPADAWLLVGARSAVSCAVDGLTQVEGNSCKDGGTPLPGGQPESANGNSSSPDSRGERRAALAASLLAVAVPVAQAWFG